MNFLVSFLSIVDAVLVLAVVITVISDRRRKEKADAAPKAEPVQKELKAEAKTSPKAEPVQKKEPEPEQKTEPAAAQAPKQPAENPRFYGINSVNDIVRLAKNSAAGVDEAVLEIDNLKVQFKEMSQEIKELKKVGTEASELRRKELLARRRSLKEKLDYQTVRAADLEKSADLYSCLLKKVAGQDVDYRKTGRLEEELIQVTAEDIRWLKKKIGIN